MSDVLLVDKPAGWTSFDVVAKIRGGIRKGYQAEGIKPTKRQLKVGHTGTLDPFATGLLVILLGDACSRTNEFLKLDKVYEATIELGKTSSTGDPEGEIKEVETLKDEKIEREHVEKILQQFVGQIEQVPPVYSAIKIGGERAYKLAREGKTVDMPTRTITIYELELLDYSYPYVTFRAHVSSGTYIRTLAEDIGRALGTGAYCAALRRTQIADMHVSEARTVDEVLLDLRKAPTTPDPPPASISQFSLIGGATAPAPPEKPSSESLLDEPEGSAILRKSSLADIQLNHDEH